MYALALVASIAIASPVAAQSNCGAYQDVAAHLSEKFGETVQTQAVTLDQRVLQNWANLETGSWTIVLVSADGVACVAASGENFSIMPQGEPV